MGNWHFPPLSLLLLSPPPSTLKKLGQLLFHFLSHFFSFWVSLIGYYWNYINIRTLIMYRMLSKTVYVYRHHPSERAMGKDRKVRTGTPLRSLFLVVCGLLVVFWLLRRYSPSSADAENGATVKYRPEHNRDRCRLQQVKREGGRGGGGEGRKERVKWGA
jgi:hypothetical protein